jgi:hypothetical protein
MPNATKIGTASTKHIVATQMAGLILWSMTIAVSMTKPTPAVPKVSE